MNPTNQSTAGNTNEGQMTIGLLDHLLDCLFSNESPNDSLTKRLDTLVQELELFEPPKALDHDENLKFINLRAKFQRLRTENLKKTEAQEDKLSPISKNLTARLMPVIERLFSLPKLPEDMWKNQILPMLASANPLSSIKSTLGKMQINCEMDKLVKETVLQLVVLKRLSLMDAGCKTADEAINFVIQNDLSVANLRGFPDVTDDHLKRLSEQCPNLKHLLVASADVTEVPKFAALQSLDFSWCRNLTDAGLVNLEGFKTLQSLDLFWSPNLTGAGLVHLEGVKTLQSLNLCGCSGLTDASLVHVGKFMDLRSLNLSECPNLTGAGLVHLEGVKTLQSLDLSSCPRLTDASLVHVGKFMDLRSLNLYKCSRLTDAGVAHLDGLKALQWLDLSSCYELTDAILVHLGKLMDLQWLDLSNCSKLTDASVTHLEGFKALRRLRFESCSGLTNAGVARLKGLGIQLWLDPRLGFQGQDQNL